MLSRERAILLVPLSLLVVREEVEGVLLDVLPSVVVSQHRL